MANKSIGEKIAYKYMSPLARKHEIDRDLARAINRALIKAWWLGRTSTQFDENPYLKRNLDKG